MSSRILTLQGLPMPPPRRQGRPPPEITVRQTRELVDKLKLGSSVRSFTLPCDSCGKGKCKCEGEASGSRTIRNGIYTLQTPQEHGHHRYKHGLVEPFTGLPLIPVHGIPKEGQSNEKDPDDDVVDCMVSFLMQDPANELNVSDPTVRFQRMHAVCKSYMFFPNDTARVTRLIPRAYTEAQTIVNDRRIANIENEQKNTNATMMEGFNQTMTVFGQIGDIQTEQGSQIGTLTGVVQEQVQQIGTLTGTVSTLTGTVQEQGHQILTVNSTVQEHGRQITTLAGTVQEQGLQIAATNDTAQSALKMGRENSQRLLETENQQMESAMKIARLESMVFKSHKSNSGDGNNLLPSFDDCAGSPVESPLRKRPREESASAPIPVTVPSKKACTQDGTTADEYTVDSVFLFDIDSETTIPIIGQAGYKPQPPTGFQKSKLAFFNKPLRMWGKGNAEISAMMRHNRQADPTVSEQIVAIRAALGILPDYQGTVYRAATLPMNIIKHMARTKRFCDPSFLSTSLGGVHMKFHDNNCRFIIMSKRGKYIQPYVADDYKPENEVTFLDGTVFVDVVVKKAGKPWRGPDQDCFIITMTEE